MDTDYLIIQGVNVVMTLIAAGLLWFIKRLWNKLEKKNEKEEKVQEALTNGVRAELKLSLLKSFGRYQKLKYVPVVEVDSIKDIYESYHALGGNGTGTSIYESILAMGHNPPPEDRNG